jgi:hypothetical protein
MSYIKCPDCGNTDQNEMAAAARNRRIICLKCYYSFGCNPRTIPLAVRSTNKPSAPKLVKDSAPKLVKDRDYVRNLEAIVRKANSLFNIIRYGAGRSLPHHAEEGYNITRLENAR